MGWEQIGLGMAGYNPLASFGIGAAPQAGATAGMGLSGLTATPWYMPQLSGGAAGMGQMMAIPGALNNMFTYRPEDQSATAGGIQGALQGAIAGSAWGWPGAIVGGTTGFFSGKK